jgi:DNA polymerase-3 subunit beta
MKLIISKPILGLAISRMQGPGSERSQAQIGIMAKENRLYFCCSDQTLAVFTDVEANIERQGVTFVQAKFFSDVVRELPDGLVHLELDGPSLKLMAGPKQEFSMRLPVMESSKWRNAPSMNFEESANVPLKKLSYMIDQIDSCIAHESTRNYATVAYLHRISTHAQSDTFRMVGTDAYRLSLCEIKFDASESFLKQGITLTKRSLSELQKYATEGFENLKIGISDDRTTLVASVPHYYTFIRLSNVKYPNYSKVIPDLKQPGVLVDKPHVLGVTKRVLLASDKSRILQLSFFDESLTLSSKNVAQSEGREKIQLDGYHGPKCDITINGKYLTDIAGTTISDRLVFQFKDSDDPMVLMPYGEPNECKTKHVLIPISSGMN